MTIVDRLFYKLTDLADRWQCSVEDILHLGMQDKAVICANLFGIVSDGDVHAYGKRDSGAARPPPGWPGDFLMVSHHCLRTLEDSCDASYSIYGGCWGDGDETNFVGVDPSAAITRDNLCMLHHHMIEVQQAYFSATHDAARTDAPQQAPGSTWPWGEHETEALRYLHKAASRFWVNHDLSDPETAPTNPEVADWVLAQMPRGQQSVRLAKSIASILRADGLPHGRRRHRVSGTN